MAAMRQLTVGSQGGAEALAICHQLIYSVWASGSMITPLARVDVDEKTAFGMLEWNPPRRAAGHFLPKHAATAGLKHRTLSHVEQEGLPPMPKDRGAEQGGVDGTLGVHLSSGNGGSRNTNVRLPLDRLHAPLHQTSLF